MASTGGRGASQPSGRQTSRGTSSDERIAFANDPSTLPAVDGPTNSAKSDRGPGDWMPEDPDFWCEYAARYTGIAHDYALAVSSEDKRMLVDVLEACS